MHFSGIYCLVDFAVEVLAIIDKRETVCGKNIQCQLVLKRTNKSNATLHSHITPADFACFKQLPV